MRSFNRALAGFAAAGVAAVLALSAASPARASTVYSDTTGDNFDGNAHMDIASVEVSNDATNITFTINLNGSIANPNDWGKYLIGIDTNAATGDTGTPVGNPWGRNIRMASGMDAFVGSWVDGGGGFQPWVFGAGWTQNGSGSPVLGTNSTTITTSLASLGLVTGQTFNFDVYSSGGNGGDSANDALANPAQSVAGWSGPYDSAALMDSYTVSVPEPMSLSLLGFAGLAATRRRR
jgi:hypothetical protein